MAKDNPLMQGLKQAQAAAASPAPERHSSPERPLQPGRAAARQGTKLVGGHFAEDVSVALKVIAAENRTTVQDLMAEAINAIFAKYGKPQIATLRSAGGKVQ
jgi:Antitoxin-like ribbon-helix-helix